MPSSNLTQISTLMELITLTNPAKLLDVGVGFGKYGVLSREYLELWVQDAEYGRKSVVIDGIEAFGDYITPLHEHIYNKIVIGDAQQVIHRLDTDYDLILLIDVLEHMDFAGGSQLLRDCYAHGRNMIISTPKDIGHQGASFGNSYERHLFQWRPEHFRGKNSFLVSNPASYIVYTGADAERVRKTRFHTMIGDRVPYLRQAVMMTRKLMHRHPSGPHES